MAKKPGFLAKFEKSGKDMKEDKVGAKAMEKKAAKGKAPPFGKGKK